MGLAAVFAGAVCIGLGGCGESGQTASNLVKRKKQMGAAGDDVMGRLGDPLTRAQAALELGESKNAAALPALKGYIEDKEADVRRNVMWAMGEIGDVSAVIEVRTRLTDHERAVRLEAAKALAKLPSPNAILWLGQALTRDGEPEVRAASAKALGKVSDANAADWLVRGLRDKERAVLVAAADALREIGKPAIQSIHKEVALMGPVPLGLVVERLAAMKTPHAARTLVAAMECAAEGGGAATVETACTALAAMGNAAVEPLVDAAVRRPGNLALKRAAGEVMKRVGKAYIPAVAKRITGWKTFPDQRELVIWVEVLKAVGQGDATAEEALAAAKKQLSGEFVIAPSDTDKLCVYPWGAVAEELFGPGPVSPVDFPPVPQSLPENGEVRLTLEGGLILPGGPRPIELDIFRHKGQWRKELCGKAYRMHKGTHEGTVQKSSGDATSARLSVDVAVMEDPWIVVGGFSTYEIEFAFKDGAWTGTFTGEFNGKAVKGAVTADVVPWYGQPTVEPDIVSGEHPRLFFRKKDIGVMRNRARTPLGGAIVKALLANVSSDVQKVGQAISWGMLYHLLGEEEYGRQAVAVVNKLMHASAFGSEGGHIHDSARNMANVSLAYDLAYNAMSQEERKEINDIFVRRAAALGVLGLGNNCLSCNSNWSAVSFGPGGVASLAVLKEKGPDDLVAPEDRQPVRKVELDAAPPPTEGVPVVEPKEGEVILDWLMAGPIQPEKDKDPLAGLGGTAAARVVPGSQIGSVGGYPVKFAPAPASARRTPDPGIPMDPHIMGMGPDGRGHVYLYALLKVREERTVKLSLAHLMMPAPTFLYINGMRFVHGDCAVLPPGLHRMLMVMTGQTAAPKFVSVNGPLEYGASLRCQWLMRQLAERRAKHAIDGEYPYGVDGYKMSSHSINRYFRHALGDHGWKTEPEGYTSFSLYETLTLAAAFRNATGHHLAYGSGMGWALPMELMRDTPGGGKGYGGAFSLPVAHLWPAVHLAPKELQPAIVWEINRRFPPERVAGLSPRDLAWMLANYPFDIKPEHPEKIMPKVMADRRKGAYLFRRSWGTDEDINTTMFWRSESPKAGTYFMCEAGSYRISGFGTAFAVEGPSNKRNSQYMTQNVVHVEGNNAPGLGKVTYFSHKPDGSGVVGADMTEVYSTPSTRDAKGADIKAQRHLAVDYSGASGAPAMWVVADRVKGGGKKSWLLHNGKECKVSIKDNTFTLTARNGATLKCTVVAPAGAKVSRDMPQYTEEELKAQAQAAAAKGKPEPSPTIIAGAAVNLPPATAAPIPEPAGEGICVTGGDEFLLVLTMQKGTPAPKVEASGAGLDAVVKVGGQEIRLQDGKLVLKK
jgi:hypothetical protein